MTRPREQVVLTTLAKVDPAAVESFLTLLRVGSDVLAAWEKYLAGHHISQGRFTVLMLLIGLLLAGRLAGPARTTSS